MTSPQFSTEKPPQRVVIVPMRAGSGAVPEIHVNFGNNPEAAAPFAEWLKSGDAWAAFTEWCEREWTDAIYDASGPRKPLCTATTGPDEELDRALYCDKPDGHNGNHHTVIPGGGEAAWPNPCGSRPYPAGSDGDDGTECTLPVGHDGPHDDGTPDVVADDIHAPLCDSEMPLRHGGSLKCTLNDGHYGAHSAVAGMHRWLGHGADARTEEGELIAAQHG